MKLFQFLIPVYDNEGQPYAGEHARLERWLVDTIGGYTKLPEVRGGWKDPSGEVYEEPMIPYQIACETDRSWEILGVIANLFPDQQAFFYADIGLPVIYHRPAVAA